MLLLVASGVIGYFGWTIGDADVPSSGYVAMAFGVIFSLLFSIGLMTLVFLQQPQGIRRTSRADQRAWRRSRLGPKEFRGERHMTLAPLLQANPWIQPFSAMGALVIGTIQLAAPKGTLPHRITGSIWVLLMLVVSMSAFFIHQLRIWGPWSPIHLLAIFTLAMLPVAVWRAHKHDVARHRRAMLGLFLGALVVAGLFTFLPGRIMHAVAFGS